MVYFENQIHEKIPVIKTGAIEENITSVANTTVTTQNRLFVWLAMGAALLALLLLTLRFTAEVKKQGTK